MALLLATPEGTVSLPVYATVEPTPVVGDWVVATAEVVVDVLDRVSLLRRRDPGRDVEQPLVANVDAVLIVCGLDRPVRSGRIRRAVTLAWDAGAVPVVVLTKADLSADSEAQAAEVAEENPGVEVVCTSAVTGLGLDRIKDLARDKTIVLLGESGAGKSSLTNALSGGEVAAIGEVRSSDAKGRHTTTSRLLHLLPGGGVIVDTPGLRAVGIWTDAEAVSARFEDLEELALRCRFNDCQHAGEPGCAIQAAVDAGEVPAERLVEWAAMLREVEAAELRGNVPERRAYERRFARVTKDAQRRKRGE